MNIEYFTLDTDTVIEGFVVTAATNYKYALQNFTPLIGRLDIQRDALKTKFYSRLEEDIVSGCVMPPITLALIHTFGSRSRSKDAIANYISKNIKNAFVLDGIQRLSTLQRASTNKNFNSKRTLHVNFIIAGSRDRLLYRMITLNNGQKPMSARHQIDVLADSFFDFEDHAIKLVAEKGKGRVRAPDTFNKADFVKGYVAYLSESVNIDNQKIIEEKMDELIAFKIIDSNIPTRAIEFSDIVDLINKFSVSANLKNWIRNQNNFIGFCVGAKNSVEILRTTELSVVEGAVANFETAFTGVNISKVNVSKVRRELVSKFIEDFDKLKNLDENEMLDKISYWI